MNKAHNPPPVAIHSLLKKMGMGEREIQVYLALLSMKIGRVSTIARNAKQERSLTYNILKRLSQKGIVSEVEREKVLHYIAESPQKLLNYVQDRREELENVEKLIEGALPYFSTLTKPLVGQPRVTMLHGIDGMKQVYRDILTQEFVGMYNPQCSYDLFDANIVTMLFGEDAKLYGRDLLVDNDGARRYLREVPQHEKYEVRLLPKDITFSTDTIVFGDVISLFAFDEDKTIVRIENQNIADTFRSWFEVLWGASQKLSHK